MKTLTEEQIEMSRKWLLGEAGTAIDYQDAANALCDMALEYLKCREDAVMIGEWK
jgi:hypothetical protein